MVCLQSICSIARQCIFCWPLSHAGYQRYVVRYSPDGESVEECVYMSEWREHRSAVCDRLAHRTFGLSTKS